MDETQVVDRLDGKDTFRHVEFCDVLGECIILDQPIDVSYKPALLAVHVSSHCHEITSW